MSEFERWLDETPRRGVHGFNMVLTNEAWLLKFVSSNPAVIGFAKHIFQSGQKAERDRRKARQRRIR